MNDYICVIGGANIDISGSPNSQLVTNDSNPGKISITLGGVARNIAENISRLGIDVEFITILGDDIHAETIRKSCKDLNISLEYSHVSESQNTSTYMFISDEEGEMQLAVSDMEILEFISPDFLSNRLKIINGAKACVIDTNLPKDSLDYLMENVNVPIFMDTVSTKKTKRVKDFIRNIHALKPNILEAEILSGIKIIDEKNLESATDLIINKGVKQIFVSLGSKGVYYTDGINKGILPTISTEIINTTGAGDSFLAGVVWGYNKGYDIEMSAKAGLSAAHICIKSPKTVSEEMSEDKILELIHKNWR